ncbi:polyprenyl synthetase family protein [Schaalia sp. 19OD2882]|uniref:polyprenyl synthetase family protein n=1 Tax=Schaalia sp. 19OD2882 TaxID=2794089 RepID=UPI001C1E8F0B|nr:polyprenyl synthetase family protein [Schaalia sp. 19OD2882]QWW19888.1 polyprenyl synthetase family protein [Schaalia sp. 19OD2882]
MSVHAPDLHVPDLEARITPGLEAVEDRLLEAVQGSRDLIDELTRHLAHAGGKRIRPVLTLVCAQLGDPDRALGEQVLTAATGVELTHLASLYHDDVMDSAPTRRGVPSAQHLWGNNRAILAGDVLFARASRMVADLGEETVRHHAHTFERLCVGQLNETFGPREGDDPVEFYLQVLADKTGSLVAAAGYLGAFHGGAGTEVADVVGEFGERIGVAFQIADDVIDICAEGTSGKTPGTDLREGVDTLPVLLLRRREARGTIDQAGRQILAKLGEDLSSDEALRDLVLALRSHDVMEETREMARSWSNRAVAVLDALPRGEARTALEAFADLMVDRLA